MGNFCLSLASLVQAASLMECKSRHWRDAWILGTAQGDGQCQALQQQPASVVKVTEVKRSSKKECALNQQISALNVVSGFNASDCRSGCGSHLRYRGKVGSGAGSQRLAPSLQSEVDVPL